MSRKAGFYLWRRLPGAEVLKTGALAIEQQDNGRISRIQFRYSKDYLEHVAAIPLDPVHAPLQQGLLTYETAGRHLPGFLDDCLPDEWGRRVVALRLNRRHVDTLTLMNHLQGAATGAVLIAPADQDRPAWPLGEDFERAGSVAQAVWDGDLEALRKADSDLALLMSGGSRTGGARPKMLVSRNGAPWLLKFNRSSDSFDMAAAEWSCLELVRRAGLKAPRSRITQLGPRRCLLVERFDVTPVNGRLHILTCNALLKDPHTQDDAHQGRYEDIALLIRKFSEQPAEDLEQLLGQLLINSVIGNTDDHLRNFSLVHDGTGWRLSPAYDIVPGEANEVFHQLTLEGKPYLPGVDNAARAGKALGLGKTASLRVGEAVENALRSWPDLLSEAGVATEGSNTLSRLIKGVSRA